MRRLGTRAAVARSAPQAPSAEEAAADRPDQPLGGPQPWIVRSSRGPGLPPPIGPYSHAVRAGGFVFVSGQPGLDPASGEVPGDSFGAQARQAFANLADRARVAGSGLDLVVSTTCWSPTWPTSRR